MTEEQVTRKIMNWLVISGWEILDYDFPGGGTGRRFNIVTDMEFERNKGYIIPDIVVYRNGDMVFFENKWRDTSSDYSKLNRMSKIRGHLLGLVRLAYPEKEIKRILFGLGFCGNFRNHNLVKESGVDVVVSIDAESEKCQIVYGSI